MKIIISHDVDHLYNTDHLKDLYFPKLWVRNSIELLRRKITLKEWLLRVLTPFRKRLHRIDELIRYDINHGIPSTFFFGMANGLGMSYSKRAAFPVIKRVISEGFNVGVHGIEYCDADIMKKEYQAFSSLTGIFEFGIRMHYVRFDNSTFKKLSDIGYVYDSSEFDKEKGYIVKAPYKVGDMWEFPLNIMDSYLSYNLDEAKEKTLKIIKEVETKGLPYLTVLFHDPHYSDAYGRYRDWYRWLINYLITKEYEFVSYQNAITELETKI